ncbi:hypothetical protein ACWDFR_13785 [Streptomyces sp. 900105755]
MSYYLLTVESSHRTGFGLQVQPGVRIRELAARVGDMDVPVPGDRLLLLFPEEGVWQAPLADFGIEAWRDGELLYTRSDPSDPEFVLAIGGNRGPEDLPVGTQIWLDDRAPTGGHRTKGWRHIIEGLTTGPWIHVPPGDDEDDAGQDTGRGSADRDG